MRPATDIADKLVHIDPEGTAWHDYEAHSLVVETVLERDSEWEQELRDYPSKHCPYCKNMIERIRAIMKNAKERIDSQTASGKAEPREQ